MPPKSVSKHISAQRLRQIKKDNYIGESGIEYNEVELEDELQQRLQAEADRLADEYYRSRSNEISEMQKIKLAFIVKLKDIKTSKGLSNSELAHSIGVSRQSLHNMINGVQNPSLELICKVAEVYRLKLVLK